MSQLSFSYLNSLAEQIILISSLLSGFSIAVLISLIVSNVETKVSKVILIAAAVSAGCFLLSLFAMTDILMKTTQGYPIKVSHADMNMSRTIGTLSFLIGIVSIASIVALSGWMKSQRVGIATSLIGLFTLVCLIMLLI